MLKRMLVPIAIVAVVVLAAGGCSSGGGSGAGEATSPESDAAAFAGDPRKAVVAGLTVEGPGPTLSWKAYDGAVLYQVTGARDDGTGAPWFWVGDETKAVFGEVSLPTLEEGAEEVDFAREFTEDAGTLTAELGVKYRWTVVALDKQGRPIGSSEVATFTCETPCGE